MTIYLQLDTRTWLVLHCPTGGATVVAPKKRPIEARQSYLPRNSAQIPPPEVPHSTITSCVRSLGFIKAESALRTRNFNSALYEKLCDPFGKFPFSQSLSCVLLNTCVFELTLLKVLSPKSGKRKKVIAITREHSQL